jgi:hypothetical protein
VSVARMLCMLALAGAGLLLPVASAGSAPPPKPGPAPGKNFTMVVETDEPRGSTDASYTITLTNKTGTQQVGSANINVPPQLTITSEPMIGSIPVNRVGNQLQPRNLTLPPDASVTITVGLRMPCVGTPDTWTVFAKQSNDFSGTGNDLTLLPPPDSQLTTALTGSCKLRFRAQPALAREGELITSVPFSQSGAAVSVETLDATGSLTKSFNGTVNVFSAAVGSDPGSNVLGSGTAVDGVALIGGLRIAASGDYNLYARATDITNSDPSSAFQIVDVANTCVQGNCHAQVGNASLDGAVNQGSGFALLTLNLGSDPLTSTGCQGYVPPNSNYYEFQLFQVNGTKVVALSYTKAEMKGRGPSSLEVCFASPQPFIAKGGAPALAFDYDGPGPLTTGAAGLLGECSDVPAPCVLDRSPSGNGGATISALVPDSLGDPRMH